VVWGGGGCVGRRHPERGGGGGGGGGVRNQKSRGRQKTSLKIYSADLSANCFRVKYVISKGSI